LCGKEKAINASGRNVANIVTGDSDKTFLLSCMEMSALNHTTIANALNGYAHSVTTWCEI
jgi:hypothetical protein